MNQPDQVVSFVEILFGNFLMTMKDNGDSWLSKDFSVWVLSMEW
jgi:hypothetical protein